MAKLRLSSTKRSDSAISRSSQPGGISPSAARKPVSKYRSRVVWVSTRGFCARMSSGVMLVSSGSRSLSCGERRSASDQAAGRRQQQGTRDMIHVVAIITAKPGKRDEVLAHFRANMPAVHAEAGCIEYGPAVDAEGGPGAKYGADTFVVIEKWESLDHLKAHAASPHMQAYGAKTRELLANREIHVLSPAI